MGYSDPEAQKRWREANKDKVRAYKKRYRSKPDWPHKVRCERLNRWYGITHEQYEIQLEEQNGCCAICGATEPGRNQKHFSVDHDHETGKVRGLLCNDCNRGLGLLGDSEESIQRVLNYLSQHIKESNGKK